jgi:thiamine biosynthesis lipoprotein
VGGRPRDAFELGPISGVIVNAAGYVATRGATTEGTTFRIGIVDPTRRSELAATVDSPGAVATSGTYERGGHLLDPRLGRQCARVASATVTGPSLAHADALATAVAVAGIDALSIIERLAEYEALTIGYDGRLRATTGFPFAPARIAS